MSTILVCSNCHKDWDEVGYSYPRHSSSIIDYRCRSCKTKKKPTQFDEEIAKETLKLAKQKQGLQDRQRIERKSFREHVRLENAVTAYADNIEQTLKEYGVRLIKNSKLPKISKSKVDEIGVIQITDTHFNELVDLPHNKYDMNVASHRLFKLIKEAKSMFKMRGIKKVLVTFTGDLTNSSRRLDELLNKATNLSKVTFVAVELIKEILLDLRQDFSVSVTSVLGNESRVNDDMSFANNALSDNYDYTIINMVRLLLDSSDITFTDLDKMELVVDINGQKVLMTHDVQKATNNQKSTQSAIGRYYLNGNPIDCIMSGHLHSTKIEYYSYRSQSLVGSNEYNEHALNLSGRAGQNIYFFGKDYRHAMSIDLQNYTEGECYDISEELMYYDCKSHNKSKKNKTILEIVI